MGSNPTPSATLEGAPAHGDCPALPVSRYTRGKGAGAAMIDRYRLSFSFDAERMAGELEALSAAGWTAHFNQGFYEGGWTGVALRGAKARNGALVADGEIFEDTPLLAACPYIRQVVETFQAPKRAIRLLRLDPAAAIKEHRDYDLGYAQGEVRLHVPVVTNPEVQFHLRNRRVIMAPGECWYLDLGHPHRVVNGGDSARVHLVIDLAVNDWLREQVPFEATPELERRIADAIADLAPAAAEENLVRFRDFVLSTPAAAAELKETADRRMFVEEMVRVGFEHGFLFTPQVVEAKLGAERQRWHAGWRMQ